MAPAMETWRRKGNAIPHATAPRSIPATARASSTGSPWAPQKARLAASAMDANLARVPGEPCYSPAALLTAVPAAAVELTAPFAASRKLEQAGDTLHPWKAAWTKRQGSPTRCHHPPPPPPRRLWRRDPKAGAPGRLSEEAPRISPPQGAKCTLCLYRPCCFALGRRVLRMKLPVWQAPLRLLPSPAWGQLLRRPRIHPRLGHPRPALHQEAAAAVHRESSKGLRQERWLLAAAIPCGATATAFPSVGHCPPRGG
mmetsp:Transcript_131895/g.282044  ORF Transcript_131895/g.282044 Transcript_131895/m.282044 type:complete len:255 (-) Transcript_131895:1422-2186(-)